MAAERPRRSSGHRSRSRQAASESHAARLAFGAAVALVGSLGALTSLPALARRSDRGRRAGALAGPNIVLVMTDDQALSQTGPEYMPR